MVMATAVNKDKSTIPNGTSRQTAIFSEKAPKKDKSKKSFLGGGGVLSTASVVLAIKTSLFPIAKANFWSLSLLYTFIIYAPAGIFAPMAISSVEVGPVNSGPHK